MHQQTLAFTMNSIQWTMQAEYWLTTTADNRETILDDLTTVMYKLSLPETTRSRIQRLLAEALRRRTESGALTLQLFTNGLINEGAAQSCGFFLIEKKGNNDVIEWQRLDAIELYLFQ